MPNIQFQITHCYTLFGDPPSVLLKTSINVFFMHVFVSGALRGYIIEGASPCLRRSRETRWIIENSISRKFQVSLRALGNVEKDIGPCIIIWLWKEVILTELALKYLVYTFPKENVKKFCLGKSRRTSKKRKIDELGMEGWIGAS